MLKLTSRITFIKNINTTTTSGLNNNFNIPDNIGKNILSKTDLENL
jgi:hypothetical protein